MDKKLYDEIIESCLKQGEDTALNTIICFLTNLRGDKHKIEWIEDCLSKIKHGEYLD